MNNERFLTNRILDMAEVTTVVNFLGGPSTGKSTHMHRLVSHLKKQGRSAEAAPEFAKEMVWQEDKNILDNQIYVFAQQQNRIYRLLGEVDTVVTDGPLLHSIVYARVYGTHNYQEFEDLVYSQHERMDNVNIWLQRDEEKYKKNGRIQELEEAKTVDRVVENVLEGYGVQYTPLPMTASVKEVQHQL